MAQRRNPTARVTVARLNQIAAKPLRVPPWTQHDPVHHLLDSSILFNGHDYQ